MQGAVFYKYVCRNEKSGAVSVTFKFVCSILSAMRKYNHRILMKCTKLYTVFKIDGFWRIFYGSKSRIPQFYSLAPYDKGGLYTAFKGK